MAGGGGKDGPQPIYKPTHSGELENSLYKQASEYKPNQQMMGDYQGFMNNVRSGTMLNGQKMPTYNAGSNFNYKTPNLSYAPQKAYQGVIDKGLEGSQQDMARAQAQSNAGMASRGFGKSGLANGANTSLGRQAVQDQRNLRRDTNFQQAQSQIDVDKTNAGLKMQGQGAQADENFRRTQQSLAANQAFNQMRQGDIGTIGTLYGQINEENMRPYQMMSDLYKTNVGIAMPQGQGGKGDPFSALLGAAGPIGAAAMKAAPVAAAACLPKGTRIETESGDSPVEKIKPGDVVKGGTVLAVQSCLRAIGHRFSRHEFDTGEVIMTLGHPYFDQLNTTSEVEHDSPYTYDILTSDGYYYINGVKIGSTMERRDYAEPN